ncbi:MAG: GAF domain-containing protein [Candidatus Manganitrophus sp.]|nr:MAG: GAF domain-containing protein [Candidatus Manganitrophus sp.]
MTAEDLQARLDTNRELIDIAALHLDWISSSLAQILHAVFLVDRDGIVLYAAGNDARMRESFHVVPGYDWSERKMGTNAVGTALAGNQAIAVSGPEHFIQLFHHYTCTGVPIHANGEVVGAIGIGTPVADGNPERMILTSHTAYVIEQELMHRQTASRAESIKAEAMMLLSNSLDYKNTLSIIAHLVVPRLADWCIIDMVEADRSIVRFAVAQADPSKSTLARDLQNQSLHPDVPYGAPQVIRTGRSELYTEISDSQKRGGASSEAHFKLIRQMNATSGMVVPIPGRGRVLGAITFLSAESDRRYNRVDLALAEDLARRAGLAVENAQLYRAAQEEIAERKRTQEALRRSEERFRQVSESGIVSLAFFDLSGRITDANDAFLKMIGYTREELLEGKVRWDQLTPPEWLERTQQAIKEFKTRGTVHPV